LRSTAPVAASTDALVWAQPRVPSSTITYASEPYADGATIAGPMAVTVNAASSNSEMELMATLSDVGDGTVTQISRSGILGSLHATDPAKSWVDKNGLSVRPFLSLQSDDYVPAGTMTKYDIPLPPAVYSRKPGHSLQLPLST